MSVGTSSTTTRSSTSRASIAERTDCSRIVNHLYEEDGVVGVLGCRPEVGRKTMCQCLCCQVFSPGRQFLTIVKKAEGRGVLADGNRPVGRGRGCGLMGPSPCLPDLHE